MGGDKKIVYFLVALIIIFAIILLIKIELTPKYDPKIYDEIYSEYASIFGDENNYNDSNLEDIQKNTIYINNDNSNSVFSNQKNVIGKIIIPRIDIRYPIIKETTKEYLKVSLTKYCGPDVNKSREFCYSRT